MKGSFLVWRRAHTRPAGSPCFNCDTALQGAWCHTCGQSGEDYHRAAYHLIWELLEGLFHADGRLWHTLPRLLFRPASLTRDYIAGKRASQVPPLRIFFIVLLLLFLIGESVSGVNHMHVVHIEPDAAKHVNDISISVYKPWDDALTKWTRAHVGAAIAHPEQLVAAMAAWAHDFAFLSLPIYGFILAMIFVFRRGFVLFDHLVFSMHSLSFVGLLIIVAMLLSSTGSAVGLLLAAPVHQFFHMRGVYRTGIFGTLLRLSVLIVAATIAFALLLVPLVFIALAALQP